MKTINGHKFNEINKPDGYCFLIERNLFDKYPLDYEHYEWWWNLPKFYREVLGEGKNLWAISHHNNMIFHYGGKSGNDWINAKRMDTDIDLLYSWFDNTKGKIEHKIYDKRQYILQIIMNFPQKMIRLLFHIIRLMERIKQR